MTFGILKKKQKQAKAVKKLIYQSWTKCHMHINYSTKNKLDDRIEQIPTNEILDL